MTKLTTLTINMFKSKVNLVHSMFGIYVLITLVTGIYQTLRYGVQISHWVDYGLMAGSIITLVFFILTAKNTEKVWTSSTYRLIPTTETKLYTANIVSSLLSIVYFGILSQIFGFILNPAEYISGGKDLNDIPVKIVISTVILVIMMVVLFYVFVTLVHLLSNIASTFLPTTG